jgi:hypothetical protein
MYPHVEVVRSGARLCLTQPWTPPGEKKGKTKMTNEAKVTHDAYVSIGCDELFYVGCDDCPETIFGPTDNEFEANGKARDHGRNFLVGGDGLPVGAYPPGVPATFSAEDIAKMPVKQPGPVTLQDRQGVFVHSFKCSICDLEFVVFSWRADRHRVGSTFCPECGERTPMLHWRAQASESLEFQTDSAGLEIYQMCPALEGGLMDDFVMPPDSRYAYPEDRLDATDTGSADTLVNGDEDK